METYSVYRQVHDTCQKAPKQKTPHWMKRGLFLVQSGLSAEAAETLRSNLQRTCDGMCPYFQYVDYVVHPDGSLPVDRDAGPWEGTDPDTCPDPVN